jgi:hypothetical protein
VVARRIICIFGLMICGTFMLKMRVANRFRARWHCQKSNRDEQLRQTLNREEQKCSHTALYSGSPAKSLSRGRQIAAQYG